MQRNIPRAWIEALVNAKVETKKTGLTHYGALEVFDVLWNLKALVLNYVVETPTEEKPKRSS